MFTILVADQFRGSSTWISISNTKLRRIHRHALRSTFGLRNLSFTSCRISHLPVGVFQTLMNLHFLNISHNNITALSGSWFSARLKSSPPINNLLEVLDVSSNRIRRIRKGDVNFLLGLRRFIANCNIISLLDSASFASVNRLEEVDFTGNHLKSLKKSSFYTLIAGFSMKRLVLRGNPLICDCRMKWIHDIFSNYARNGQSKHAAYIFHNDYCKTNHLKLKIRLFVEYL